MKSELTVDPSALLLKERVSEDLQNLVMICRAQGWADVEMVLNAAFQMLDPDAQHEVAH